MIKDSIERYIEAHPELKAKRDIEAGVDSAKKAVKEGVEKIKKAVEDAMDEE